MTYFSRERYRQDIRGEGWRFPLSSTDLSFFDSGSEEGVGRSRRCPTGVLCAEACPTVLLMCDLLSEKEIGLTRGGGGVGGGGEVVGGERVRGGGAGGM